MRFAHLIAGLALALALTPKLVVADEPAKLRQESIAAMEQAAKYYHDRLASHGGYVYFYSLDTGQRWGEGRATADQIWVQPPGTPTVGLAYLQAYDATGDAFYLNAATDAALAVIHGQLKSGGWTNSVDFDSRSPRTAAYRNGKGQGKNNSTLDDGITQSAIRLLIHTDRAHGFRHPQIRQAAQTSLDAMLQAQFPNGAFPQVWDSESAPRPPAMPASYPQYDWRNEGRIKNYWDMYTLNDNVAGYVAQTLIEAAEIYRDEKYLRALRELGNFLISAQMPDPQPAWAQQYNYQMQPIWARKFEPPGISGDESQEAIDTLMKISLATKDRKYLQPIPRALAYLRASLLADGRLARYYELKTNRPLYMNRRGKTYTLTYDDSNLPAHYGWKWDSRLDELARRHQSLRKADDKSFGEGFASAQSAVEPGEVRRILSNLDRQGRWVSTYDGARLVGQAKMQIGESYLSSELFGRNLSRLSRFLSETDRP